MIVYKPAGTRQFLITLMMRSVPDLVLKGVVHPDETLEIADIRGHDPLRDNSALVTNLAAFGRHELLSRRTRSNEKRSSHSKQAAFHRNRAIAVAGMVLDLDEQKHATWAGWCSGCFAHARHRKVRGRHIATYLCSECGSPTIPCAVPTCSDAAVRGFSAMEGPRYCAAHKHEIPSFEKMGQRIASLDDYAEWLKFEKINARRVTKVVGVAALAAASIGPQAFATAPAIGGAIGANAGTLGLAGANLSGAAATNFGLAWLGGGSIAAGGAGMAGGAVVVGATGAALGGTLGAVATSAYVRADKSFRIEKLRDGEGPAVIIASGFLTEGSSGWGTWRRLVYDRYPRSPVYRLHWGARELKAFAVLAGVGGGKLASEQFVGKFAAKASKKAAGLGPLAGLLVAIDLATNPWSVARNRATMTGIALADLIARSEDAPFVLIGHSLGGRVMVTAAQALATKDGKPRIAEMHLLAAAVGVNGDWRLLHEATSGTVWNYFSRRDTVLSTVFRAAELGRRAIGHQGMKSRFETIKDVDETKRVDGHSAYFDQVTLRH